MDQKQGLELEEDEAQHLAEASNEPSQNVTLAQGAAALTLIGLMAAEDKTPLNTPKSLISLLLAKSAQNIRFACIGLNLGYYSGASAVIRSALDALVFAVLIDRDPGEIAQWLRNELSKGKNDSELNLRRSEQLKRAKKALFDSETNRRVIKEGVDELWELANKRIHATITGLADEFGIDVGDLIPDDFDQAFVNAGEDFEKALELYVMLSSFGQNVLPIERPVGKPDRDSADDLIAIPILCHYVEDTHTDLGAFAFYVAHRLLDMTKSTFQISDDEFNKGFKLWHKELQRLHDA